MEDDAEWLAQRTVEHKALRDLMVERLGSIPGVSVIPPAGSSYMFPLVESPRWAGNGPADDQEIPSRSGGRGAGEPRLPVGPAGRGRFRINSSQDKKRLLSAAERITAVLVVKVSRARPTARGRLSSSDVVSGHPRYRRAGGPDKEVEIAARVGL